MEKYDVTSAPEPTPGRSGTPEFASPDSAHRALPRSTAKRPRPSVGRWWFAGLLIAIFPLAVWLLGSMIVWLTPPVYRSAVVVRVDPAEQESADLFRHGEVGQEARRELEMPSGMSGPADVMVQEGETPDVIMVEAQGASPEEARRLSLAYAKAYESYLARHPQSARAGAVWLPLVEGERMVHDTSHERRVVLGVGVLAFVGLFLAIPFVKIVERALPARVDRARRRPGSPRLLEHPQEGHFGASADLFRQLDLRL